MSEDAGGVVLTRLARAVRAVHRDTDARPARDREKHRQTNWLRDVILGGQDGLVNILGIILGVIAGGGSKTVLLAAGAGGPRHLRRQGLQRRPAGAGGGDHHRQPGRVAGLR